MNYKTKNFDNLIGLKGFSEEILKNHFTLYQGYVNNTNKLSEQLTTYHKQGKSSTPEYAELKRRFGWEFNGMRLHKLYFSNLTKAFLEPKKNSILYKKIEKNYGSFANWQDDFIKTASLRGIGWVILYYDAQGNKLFNSWINEHDQGHLAGAAPLLVVDVFEHAFMLDYGLKKAEYLQALLRIFNWPEIEKRLSLISK